MSHASKITFAALLLAFASSAEAQLVRDYTVFEQNPHQISTYADMGPEQWANRFITLVNNSSSKSLKDLTYDPDDLESMRIYIWTKLEDTNTDITRVLNRFERKAERLSDERNIKIAKMTRKYIEVRSSALTGYDVVDAVADITQPYAQDKDWFVVFFANSLNFEAHYLGQVPIDPNFVNFAQFALKGHETDLDYDEARLSYLSLRKIEQIRDRDLVGYYDTLSESNAIKDKLGLPKSHFADLINAANLHQEIFTDPSSIRIAEEAFINDDLSPANIASAQYTLGSLYTAHGFSEKAIETYDAIDLATFDSGGAYEHAITIDLALNHFFMGDRQKAESLLLSIEPLDLFVESKTTQNLLEIALQIETVTPELKSSILKSRQNMTNVLTLAYLNQPQRISMQGAPSELTLSVDKTTAMHSGNIEDLTPISSINQVRIESFIELAKTSLLANAPMSSFDAFVTNSLNAVGLNDQTAKLELLSDYTSLDNHDPDIARLFKTYFQSNLDPVNISERQPLFANSANPFVDFTELLILARLCIMQDNFECAWEHYYAAERQSKSSGKTQLSNYSLLDLKLTLMAHENNHTEVLSLATEILETQASLISDRQHIYSIVNRTASAFEASGYNSHAYRMITLGGSAGMSQPYANHLTEIRLMLALNKFREAKSRLDSLIVEGGRLSQSIYEKSLAYAAYAALGETDTALDLSQQVRAGSKGLNDPLLNKAVQPYLYLGDYYIYAHEKPFEAEQYRLQYINAQRATELSHRAKSNKIAEARIRALNASEVRSLAQSRDALANTQSRMSLLSLSALCLGALSALFGFMVMTSRRQIKALNQQNAALDNTRKTHEYFLSEMERRTALETTALSASLDTISRTDHNSPQLITEKITYHIDRLKHVISRLAFQDRIFTQRPEQPVKVELEAIKAIILDSSQPAASRKDISILFDIDDLVRTVHTQKSLLTEALSLFINHSIEHTSCDVIQVKMQPFKLSDQDYIRTSISDEGDGLSKFDAKLVEGDVSPNILERAGSDLFASQTAIMAINNAGGRFESLASPGFGHVLTFDLPAVLMTSPAEPVANNIIEFRKDTANDG